MNPNPQTLDEALEELEDEDDIEPLLELNFRRKTVDWSIIEDMGLDYDV